MLATHQQTTKANAAHQATGGAAKRAVADARALFERQHKERWGDTPTLTGGEANNLPSFRAEEFVSHRVALPVIRNGKLVEQLFRQPTDGQKAFIDQLTFVFDKDSLCELSNRSSNEFETSEDYINVLNPYLYEIFGFGASHNREKSANFYSESFNLGDHETCYGYVCIGGGINKSNANTICIELTAFGLGAADDGWEHRLHAFSTLPEMYGFRYTRVDIAHDFLGGKYTVDDALKAYYAGGFTTAFTRPKIRKEGDDWFNDTSNGRTLYIGTRQSSRLLRFYEKGKQLKMQDSPWVRCELELRSRDIIIPKDIVIHAGDYLCASYPAFEKLFSSDTPKNIIVKERIIQRCIEHSIKYLRIQGSKAVAMLKEFGKDNDEIISLFDPNVKLPKGTHPGQYFAAHLNIDWIHHKLIPNPNPI
ncbi:replication initiation factor domain-containing protein [Suttonella ornithocola]|uniref:Replication initiation factor n=2 Tax=Suttonella ornithocola TaxID=279832 RepID=A0A380MQ77_9GAMM|nr:replication initiation factor domain-containing protein [Suttonella ornithocola]SUO93467.1 Replication initiation factor [Suttonella ornithocola]